MCNACSARRLSRRPVLGGGLAPAAVTTCVGPAKSQPERAAESPDAALDLLLEGNERYASNRHTACGAVNAAVGALQKGNDLPGHIAALVRAMKPGIAPVLEEPGDDLPERAAVANVRYTVQRLVEARPILADLVVGGELRIVGAIYNLATGKVALL